MLADIALVTGAKYITEDRGMKLSDVKIEDLGNANQVKITKDNTLIIGGKGNQKEISNTINILKKQLETLTSKFEIEQAKTRIAKLAGGVAVIYVGAATELEMKDKKLRIEDALSATKAAVEEGIVAGGGTAYLDIYKSVEKFVDKLDKYEIEGGKLVLNALKAPAKQIATNAGLNSDDVVKEILSKEKGVGYNIISEKYENMKKAGVIDPTKVTKTALLNSSSIAGMILTTESLVVNLPEETPKASSLDSGMGY